LAQRAESLRGSMTLSPGPADQGSVMTWGVPR
jgi:hypothetical protein